MKLRNNRTLVGTVVVTLAIVFGVSILVAVDSIGVFELGPGAGDEGGLTNILGSAAIGGPDWADLFDADGNFTPPALGGQGGFIKDDIASASATDRTVYSGGPGDKNSDIVQNWTWTGSNVPSKDDIPNAYAYTVTVGTQKYIYVGLERLDPSGDSHLDLEFFQKQIGLEGADANGNCVVKPCGFSGENTNGDLLVDMDFVRGGAIGTVTVRRRQSGANDNYILVETLNGEGCNAGDTVCGFNNGGTINGGPWDNFDNHGAIITNLEQNAFTEIGLNVTALGFGTPCLSTIQVKTRSSQSFTSALKDFALHGFEACTATVATQIHQGESVGATHVATNIDGGTLPSPATFHDKAIVTGQVGAPTPTGTVKFEFFPSTDNCSLLPGQSAIEQTVGLTEVTAPSGGNPGIAAAESMTRTSSAGAISYKATFIPTPGSAYTAQAVADCEKLTVSARNSSVSTDIRVGSINGASVLNKAVDISSGSVQVVDVAFVTGVAPVEPTGTVTFFSYPNADCTGTPAQAIVKIIADSDLTDGQTTAVTSPITLSTPGVFLCLKAQYNGDNNYQSSSLSKAEPLCAFPFSN